MTICNVFVCLGGRIKFKGPAAGSCQCPLDVKNKNNIFISGAHKNVKIVTKWFCFCKRQKKQNYYQIYNFKLNT